MATENLAPQVISRIMGEIRDLVRSPPDGVTYTENEDNTVSEIHAIIQGPGRRHASHLGVLFHVLSIKASAFF
jgi:ubiquitin-protein ligase